MHLVLIYPSTIGRRIQKLTLVVPAERMLGEREFGQRVIVALETYWCGVAYLADDLDAWSGLANAKSFA